MKNQRTFNPYKAYEIAIAILYALHSLKMFSTSTLMTRICQLQELWSSHNWKEFQLAYESLTTDAKAHHINIKQAIEYYR